MYRRKAEGISHICVGTMTCRKCCNINAVGKIGNRRMIELRRIEAQSALSERYPFALASNNVIQNVTIQ